MRLYGTMHELFDFVQQLPDPRGKLFRNAKYLPKGTAVDVSRKFPKGTILTTPMTEHSGWGHAAPPPTVKTRSASAYMEKVEVAFGGCVWHIGGGNSYNVTTGMADDDGWYLVNATDYPHC